MKWILRTVFIVMFCVAAYYIAFVETERYETNSIVLLKDLENKQQVNLNDILLKQNSSTMQDSKVLELYIRSHEMYRYLDKLYQLTKHYTSDVLDPLQRLYPDATLPYWKENQQNLMKKYNENLIAVYDDPSGTLKLTFIHTNPRTAQKILESIIAKSEEVINAFAKENAEIALKFVEQQSQEKRAVFMKAIKALIAYQVKHHTIDPSLEVERKSTILATLESELIKTKVEYDSKRAAGWNPNGKEMIMLQKTEQNIQKAIAKLRASLAGTRKLNTNVFEFQVLKSDMEFSKEVYRQTLINQEEVKIEVAQQSKHLIVVSKPTLADDYSYPNKLWDIFTVFLVLFLFYGILVAIIGLIESHRD